MEGFPERLRKLREAKGLLQRELAEKLNLSRVAIKRAENILDLSCCFSRPMRKNLTQHENA